VIDPKQPLGTLKGFDPEFTRRRLERLHTFDVNKPAAQLAKELPYDEIQLWAIVNTPTVSLERRAKILEVIIHHVGESGIRLQPGELRHEDFVRNAMYALYNDPAVFDQLSKSTELVHTSHLFNVTDLKYPATFLVKEVMFTVWYQPGHQLDQRGRFEEELAKWPAETRGRMLFHLEDAYKIENGKTPDEREEVGRFLASQYGKMTAEDKDAFKAGYTQARETTNFPKDGPNALPK
jgi:hypothetical protein